MSERKRVEMEQVEFLKMRLEHTLTHNREVTRLIYIIDGSLLLVLSHIFKNPSDFWTNDWRIHLIALCIGILGTAINYLHAKFIQIQNDWYKAFDRQIREILNNLGETKRECERGSSGNMFVWIHRSVMIFFIVFTLIDVFLWIKCNTSCTPCSLVC